MIIRFTLVTVKLESCFVFPMQGSQISSKSPPESVIFWGCQGRLICWCWRDMLSMAWEWWCRKMRCRRWSPLFLPGLMLSESLYIPAGSYVGRFKKPPMSVTKFDAWMILAFACVTKSFDAKLVTFFLLRLTRCCRFSPRPSSLSLRAGSLALIFPGTARSSTTNFRSLLVHMGDWLAVRPMQAWWMRELLS